MNIVQKQADEWIRYYPKFLPNAEEFMDKLRSKLYNYHKDSDKVIFLQFVSNDIKKKFDDHVEECPKLKSGLECGAERNFEDVLFFLQNDIDQYESYVDKDEYPLTLRNDIKGHLETILVEINTLKAGQEVLFNELEEQFKDLEDNNHLRKSTWQQLFFGKLTEMVAGGVLSESVSKKIVELAKEKLSEIL